MGGADLCLLSVGKEMIFYSLWAFVLRAASSAPGLEIFPSWLMAHFTAPPVPLRVTGPDRLRSFTVSSVLLRVTGPHRLRSFTVSSVPLRVTGPHRPRSFTVFSTA